MKRAIKKIIIEGSVLAAVGSLVFFASGIEGGAPLLPCAIGMAVCIAWIAVVEVANG